MKKLVAVLLCALLLLAQIGAVAEVRKADCFPLSEPVTYSVVMMQQGGAGSTESDAINQFDIFKMYAEDTNVHFDITCIPQGSMAERLTLMLAGGSYPDCFFRNTITVDDVKKYAADGVFIRLNDYINEEYMPNFMKAIAENDPQLLTKMADENGDIYYILGGTASYLVGTQWAINTTWLKNLGLEMPTTTDEFIEVMRAFRDNDANGNGDPNDEIPFSFSFDKTNGGYFSSVYNTFGTATGYYVDDNDQVAYGPVTENYRSMVKFLNTLYEEKLIDQELFTHDRSTFLAKGQLDPLLYGSFLNWRAGEVVGDVIADENYASLILSVDGTIHPWTPSSSFSSFLCLAITDKCQDVETLIRFIDYTFDPMVSELGRRGGSPTFTTINPDGTLTPNPIPEEAGTLGNWFILSGHSQQVPMFSVDEYARMFASSASAKEKYAIDDFYAPYLGKAQIKLDDFKSAEESEILSDIITDLEKYVEEMLAAWVSGERNVDADWDAYVRQVNNLGLDTYLSTYQAIYDRVK